MAKSKTLTAKKIVEALESGALVPVLSGTVKSSTREGGVLIVTEFTLDSIGLVAPRQAVPGCRGISSWVRGAAAVRGGR